MGDVFNIQRGKVEESIFCHDTEVEMAKLIESINSGRFTIDEIFNKEKIETEDGI